MTTPESEIEAVEEAAVDAEAAEIADTADEFDTEIAADDVALPEIPAVFSDRPIQTVGRRKEAVVRVRLMPGSTSRAAAPPARRARCAWRSRVR